MLVTCAHVTGIAQFESLGDVGIWNVGVVPKGVERL